MFGVGDRVKITKSSNKDLIGKETEIASVCGTVGKTYYHLKIDGEQQLFYQHQLQRIKRREENGTRSKRH